jgi:4-amino-4-deoxy-L-arabinose transferase-like glycosyltransferase
LRLNKKQLTVTLLLFLLVIGLRIYHVDSSPYSEYDSWRQSDTEAIARNFVEQRFNMFYPQLNYQGPFPNYVQLELQIIPFAIAGLYKIFGYHFMLARVVPILFFTGSAVFVFLVACRYYSLHVAWLSLLFYGLLPINWLYSRAIMPESAALFFFIGAFYLFSEWIRVERSSVLFTGAVFTSLAILEKVPTVFIGIPMIVMVLMKYKKNAFYKWELYAFSLIALLPTVLYYFWMQKIAESAFVMGIATRHVLPEMFSSIFTHKSGLFFLNKVPKMFTWHILLLGIAGFFITRWREDFPMKCLALAMALELVTIVAVIRFDYYLIFFGPPLALFAASYLSRMFQYGFAGKLASSIVILLFVISAYEQVQLKLNTQNEMLLKQARIVEIVTQKMDLIVSGADDPSLLNAAHRAGWRISNSIPDNPLAELDYFIANGARYFVPLHGYIDHDPDGSLKNYLETNFVKIEAEQGYEIYKLTKD